MHLYFFLENVRVRSFDQVVPPSSECDSRNWNEATVRALDLADPFLHFVPVGHALLEAAELAVERLDAVAVGALARRLRGVLAAAFLLLATIVTVKDSAAAEKVV